MRKGRTLLFAYVFVFMVGVFFLGFMAKGVVTNKFTPACKIGTVQLPFDPISTSVASSTIVEIFPATVKSVSINRVVFTADGKDIPTPSGTAFYYNVNGKRAILPITEIKPGERFTLMMGYDLKTGKSTAFATRV